MQIGSITLRNSVALAPMSGVTDLPFRRLAMRYGAGMVVSEMVASHELAIGHPETVMRAEGKGIWPHVVQLAGREPEWMERGAELAQEAGADIIDINMGCPAKKVTGGYSGSALMKDPERACSLIEATVKASSVPVTVKMRLGWDHDSLNAPDLAREAESLGAQLITVHGRTRQQFYKGQADWSAIRAVRNAISIPLIANGDLNDCAEVEDMLSKSSADGVMVGRGAYGRPWLPGHVAHYLATGERLAEPYDEELLALVLEHYAAILAYHSSAPVNYAVRAARKHLDWYMTHQCPEPDESLKELRRQILTSSDADKVRKGLDLFFQQSPKRQAA
ncbi:tRNA dihydrouridine synthase DusB [Coralliovum pocilloporae]|uniref:tRNA dihydrouridine synthase DusB n=1 Tax=Coralliovum pocilloporae TaxID=3066369 RepID=UPI003307B410